ncbi:EexN family lipoprotein [Sulfuriferula sp.]|uniref:EexN family lipoprotein n=1 Tax=Sulfuriferula sp. TaxID=2025307 RepID=UPI00272F13D7|nr:EexN family lipoprotein [Sulfuriferula sp.]MDP2027871.1 EexN family lipoprotein [Sulfuriferula sp.]
MKRKILASFIPLLILIGCDAKKEEVTVQTVDWYLTHDVERKAMQKECQNNPGELAQTPNCINASLAGKKTSTKSTVNQRF